MRLFILLLLQTASAPAPLETGLWFYRFHVDGLKVAVPGNPRLRTGAISSIL